MSVSILLATAAAGGIGAASRYAIDWLLLAARHKGFPVGILVVNITGSLALGVLTGLGSLLSSELDAILGVGLLGGYTTFSACRDSSARETETLAAGASQSVRHGDPDGGGRGCGNGDRALGRRRHHT